MGEVLTRRREMFEGGTYHTNHAHYGDLVVTVAARKSRECEDDPPPWCAAPVGWARDCGVWSIGLTARRMRAQGMRASTPEILCSFFSFPGDVLNSIFR